MTNLVDELLNEVAMAMGREGCEKAAELLIVYVGRNCNANQIGGTMWGRLRGLLPAAIEFATLIDEGGAAWAAADPMVGGVRLRTLVAAPGGRWAA
eukprot:15346465-Alexandrium_andersonii.AAC.1